MPPNKRAVIPDDSFGSRRSALDKLTSGDPPAQDTPAPEPPPAPVSAARGAASLLQRAEVAAPDSAVRRGVSFYLGADHEDKLEDLARAYRRHTGKRINQQEVIRLLIEGATLDTLLAAKSDVS